MGFSSILKRCIMPDSCYSSYEDRLELVREINDSVFSKLVSTYQQIKAAGAPDAKIFTIGYPQIALPGGDCADNVHLDASEVNFSAQLISYLDSVIQAAAAKAGVGYIDVQKALNGHRLCEGDRYSVALNGLSAGNDSPRLLHGPFGNESFHPNYIGHQLLEAAVVVATANLSSAMPGPDPSAHPPAEEGLEILNAPKSGRGVNVTEYDSGISSDIIYKDSLGDVNINGASHSLPPTSNIQIELHSDPVLLGAFSTDSSGDLTAQIHIPDAVQPGFHRLDILVKDISGQDIDIYKTVYIAASPDDWDGNKLPDRNDICVGTAPSGQDLDHDSVDDSCDGYIGRTQAYPAEKQSPAAEPDVLAASTTKPTVPPAKTNQYKTASQNLRVPMFYIWGAGLAAAAFAVLAFATKD